jgi:hypothetical protein
MNPKRVALATKYIKKIQVGRPEDKQIPYAGIFMFTGTKLACDWNVYALIFNRLPGFWWFSHANLPRLTGSQLLNTGTPTTHPLDM